MNEFSEHLRGMSRDRLLLVAKQLQERLEQSESRRHEPLAIVGAACRFPGAANIEEYWRLLRDGTDAIREVPPERRWDKRRFYDPNPDAAGKMYVWRGGFLDRVEWFDAGLFGIARREALRMDPQQRLLMEIVWESLQRAGQPLGDCKRVPRAFMSGLAPTTFCSSHAAAVGRLKSIRIPAREPPRALPLATFLRARAQRAERARRHGVLLLAGRVAFRLSIASRWRIARRYRRGGQLDVGSGDLGLLFQGSSTLARRAMPHVRRRGQRLRPQRGLRGDRRQAALRRPGRSRHDPGRHSWNGDQPRRPNQRTDRAQRNESGAIDPRGVARRGTYAGGPQLRRSPRDGHVAGRPDRIAGARPSVRGDHAADRPLLVGSVKTNLGIARRRPVWRAC